MKLSRQREEYEFGKMTPDNESEDGVAKNSKEQELASRKMSEIISREGLEGRWRVTTADERVERVGGMVRRSEMEEGLLY